MDECIIMHFRCTTLSTRMTPEGERSPRACSTSYSSISVRQRKVSHPCISSSYSFIKIFLYLSILDIFFREAPMSMLCQQERRCEALQLEKEAHSTSQGKYCCTFKIAYWTTSCELNAWELIFPYAESVVKIQLYIELSNSRRTAWSLINYGLGTMKKWHGLVQFSMTPFTKKWTEYEVCII